MTKSIKIDYANKIALIPKYIVQNLADVFSGDEFSIKILFLPLAHQELHIIKMVWRYVKTEVEKSNFDFKLAALEQHALHKLEKLDSSYFLAIVSMQ